MKTQKTQKMYEASLTDTPQPRSPSGEDIWYRLKYHSKKSFQLLDLTGEPVKSDSAPTLGSERPGRLGALEGKWYKWSFRVQALGVRGRSCPAVEAPGCCNRSPRQVCQTQMGLGRLTRQRRNHSIPKLLKTPRIRPRMQKQRAWKPATRPGAETSHGWIILSAHRALLHSNTWFGIPVVILASMLILCGIPLLLYSSASWQHVARNPRNRVKPLQASKLQGEKRADLAPSSRNSTEVAARTCSA